MTPDDFEIFGVLFSGEGGERRMSVDMFCVVDGCHWALQGGTAWRLGELRELAQAHLDEAHPVSPGPSPLTP